MFRDNLSFPSSGVKCIIKLMLGASAGVRPLGLQGYSPPKKFWEELSEMYEWKFSLEGTHILYKSTNEIILIQILATDS